MYLNDKSYLKAHDSISFDVMINYILDGVRARWYSKPVYM